MTKRTATNKVISWLVGGEPKPNIPSSIILNILNELDVRILEEKEAMSQKLLKEMVAPHAMCYSCGCDNFGVPPKEDMQGITVSTGTCKVCKKKNVTLIPIADFIGEGD
jgi:hypothetical protein